VVANVLGGALSSVLLLLLELLLLLLLLMLVLVLLVFGVLVGKWSQGR